MVCSLLGETRGVTHTSGLPPPFAWTDTPRKSRPRSHGRLRPLSGVVPGAFSWNAYCLSTLAQANLSSQLLTGIWKQGTICGGARTVWGHQVRQAWSPFPTGWRGQWCSHAGGTLGQTHPLHCFSRLEHYFIFCLKSENLGQIPKKGKSFGSKMQLFPF